MEMRNDMLLEDFYVYTILGYPGTNNVGEKNESFWLDPQKENFIVSQTCHVFTPTQSFDLESATMC